MPRNGYKAHRDLIQALGGPTKVARALTEMTGDQLNRVQVAQWRVRGVAWKYRPTVVQLAQRRRKKRLIPGDFIIERSAA